MTRKELDAAKNALREQCRGRQMTKAEALLSAEYSCRDMMICIFAYDGTAGITNEDGFNFKRYLSPYVQTLGRKRYDKVREDQLKSFEGVTISRGVFTDDEGCTYNSINW